MLSPREVEVLALAADGLTHEEMARRMFIARTSVERHILNARVKLGGSNCTHAVAIALRLRLLPKPYSQ